MHPCLSVLPALELYHTRFRTPHSAIRVSAVPRPRITKPDCRQKVQPGVFRTPVRDRDLDQYVFDVSLRVFDEDIEVAVVIEDAGIDKFELALLLTPVPVLLDQAPLG